jgi:hypothetical protein
MGRRVTYRLVVINQDGTRSLLMTGIPAAKAAVMQQILDSEKQTLHVALEPEQKADGPRVE